MLAMPAAERRTRLARRHRLAGTPAPDVPAAARAMVALHATDPASVYLSALARCPHATIDDVASALYAERAMVRMLAMRRTLFVVPTELAPVVHHAASLDVAARLRRQLLKQLATLPTEPALTGDLDAWLRDVESGVEDALRHLGRATGAQLAEAEQRLRTALLPVTDKSYDVRRAITSPVLTLMSAEGRIVRDQPRGGWTSRQHTWAPGAQWWPDGVPRLAMPEARAELARRWLQVFGPAPISDLQWWTGWPLGITRAAVSSLDVVEVDLDGEPGLVLADDVEPEAPAAPGATLLPALDPTPMGWQRRDWFLGPHRDALFDRFGNIGPTVWWGGAIVGGWATTAGGAVAWRLLEDCGREAEAAIAAAAGALEGRIDGAVVVPSFRTPLERELAAPR